MVSEKKVFEHCEQTPTDGRRTDDGRRIHGYTISSPMSQGSGELKLVQVLGLILILGKQNKVVETIHHVIIFHVLLNISMHYSQSNLT